LEEEEGGMEGGTDEGMEGGTDEGMEGGMEVGGAARIDRERHLCW